jgi:hypothetical protein
MNGKSEGVLVSMPSTDLAVSRRLAWRSNGRANAQAIGKAILELGEASEQTRTHRRQRVSSAPRRIDAIASDHNVALFSPQTAKSSRVC